MLASQVECFCHGIRSRFCRDMGGPESPERLDTPSWIVARLDASGEFGRRHRGEAWLEENRWQEARRRKTVERSSLAGQKSRR